MYNIWEKPSHFSFSARFFGICLYSLISFVLKFSVYYFLFLQEKGPLHCRFNQIGDPKKTKKYLTTRLFTLVKAITTESEQYYSQGFK